MRLIDADMAEKILREYADDVGCNRGEYELANGILKAVGKLNDVPSVHEWVDIDVELPKEDKYILLSFSNFNLPVIGRYEEDENGGAFYIGDELETCVSQDLIVNAWMPLPDSYRTEEQNG